MLVMWLCFFCSIYTLFKFFKKKIMVLLSLELCFVTLVCLYLLNSFNYSSSSSFFTGMVFLTLMVIDSVFGLSLLIFSSRNSTFFNNFLFFF